MTPEELTALTSVPANLNGKALFDKYFEDLGKLIGKDPADFKVVAREIHVTGIVGAVVPVEHLFPTNLYPEIFSTGKRFNFIITHKTTKIHQWQFAALPGCCAVLVSTATFTWEPRKKGVNTLSNKFRQELAKSAGFSCLLISYIDEATNKIAKRESFAMSDPFTNKRTGRQVTLAYKVL